MVEDDAESRESLRELLEASGYGVETARNGAEALASLARRLPALVLLDLQMPIMDGWELLAKIRARSRYSALPIAVISGEHFPPEGYPSFRKPVDAERLLAFVRGRVPLRLRSAKGSRKSTAARS